MRHADQHVLHFGSVKVAYLVIVFWTIKASPDAPDGATRFLSRARCTVFDFNNWPGHSTRDRNPFASLQGRLEKASDEV